MAHFFFPEADGVLVGITGFPTGLYSYHSYGHSIMSVVQLMFNKKILKIILGMSGKSV